ncbi:MAG: hypothetical protein WA672_11295 [Candidatus Angelobacter sp.]
MLVQHLFGDSYHVFWALTQWRDFKLELGKPVIKVTAEASGFDQIFKVLVGRRDNANIYTDFLLPPRR